MMPFRPYSAPEDYPEREHPRRLWDEWGPQEQERNLIEKLGRELFESLKEVAPCTTNVPRTS